MFRWPFLSVSATALALSACASFDPVEAERPVAPDSFAYSDGMNYASDPNWWRLFGEPDLDGLVERAMTSNESLEAGLQRVEQARAGLQITGAAQLPSLSGSGDISATDRDGNSSDDGSLGVRAAYELDLFGRNRALTRAAAAQLDAAQFTQDALELSVQADVAATYFNLLALRERTRVSTQDLEASERVLELVETQYDAGAVSGFDLARQRSAVAVSRARLRPLIQSTRQTEHALAVLLGEAPEAFSAPQGDLNAIAPPSIDTGLPSDLLLRRPDLKAAEASLRGAEANIDAARAAFFPTIDLSAALTETGLTGTSSTVGAIAAGVLAPIFTGGRIEGALDQTEARYLELASNYRQSVLTSLRDVEDALVALEAAELSESDLTTAAEEARRAFEIAEVRYQAGADSLISVLDAQRNLLTAEDSLVQAQAQRLTASVSLFRALGGGW